MKTFFFLVTLVFSHAAFSQRICSEGPGNKCTNQVAEVHFRKTHTYRECTDLPCLGTFSGGGYSFQILKAEDENSIWLDVGVISAGFSLKYDEAAEEYTLSATLIDTKGRIRDEESDIVECVARGKALPLSLVCKYEKDPKMESIQVEVTKVVFGTFTVNE